MPRQREPGRDGEFVDLVLAISMSRLGMRRLIQQRSMIEPCTAVPKDPLNRRNERSKIFGNLVDEPRGEHEVERSVGHWRLETIREQQVKPVGAGARVP